MTDKKPDEEKPEEDNPKQQSAEQAVAAPLTMAPPRVEAKEQPAAAAPSPGIAAAVARVQAAWEKTLVSHLNRFKRYPDAARARNNQGDVAVEFRIDRMGSLVASRVVRSSGLIGPRRGGACRAATCQPPSRAAGADQRSDVRSHVADPVPH